MHVPLRLKMTTAQVVETSVTVNNNSPIQDYVHPDDQTQPTFEMSPEFKAFTVILITDRYTVNTASCLKCILDHFNIEKFQIFNVQMYPI